MNEREYVVICPQCGEDNIYGSGKLTDGLCLNCFTRNKEESRLADIEAELDYYDGCGCY